jgi:hypothetical protein
MTARFLRILRNPKTAAFLAVLVLAAAAPVYMARRGPMAPAPKPPPNAARVEVQGALVTAEVYEEAGAAQRAFGFDIRGAGLLPVGLVVDNRSPNAIRINPQQTFLIDRRNLAWPLLTADQARDRVAAGMAPEETAKNSAGAEQWLKAAGTLTGFALDVFVQDPAGAANPAPAGWRAWFGALVPGDGQAREKRIRRNLIEKFLRNPRLQSGESALGYLFFPGREEARGAEVLRLGLELDGHVRVVQIPLAPAPPAVADQSRPMAR